MTRPAATVTRDALAAARAEVALLGPPSHWSNSEQAAYSVALGHVLRKLDALAALRSGEEPPDRYCIHGERDTSDCPECGLGFIPVPRSGEEETAPDRYCTRTPGCLIVGEHAADLPCITEGPHGETRADLVGEEETAPDRPPNVEAADHMEDDPLAWAAWVNVVKVYGSQFADMTKHLQSENGAAEVLAGAMLSYLADQHNLYLRREGAASPPPPDLDAAWREAEALLPEGWRQYLSVALDDHPIRAAVRYVAQAGRWSDTQTAFAGGATPAEALRNLRVALAETPGEPEP